MSAEIARSKAEALANECSLILSNIPLFVEIFPDKASLYSESLFSDLESQVKDIVKSEPEIRGHLGKLREIYDVIEESPLTAAAGEEYLSKFDLYQMAEKDPNLLDKEVERVKKEKNKGYEEIENLKKEIHTLTEENDHLEKELEKLGGRTDEEQEVEMQKHKTQIEELRRRIMESENEIATKQREIEEYKCKIEEKMRKKQEEEEMKLKNQE